ncbi:hypothetical protein RB195_009224 [Necator americanus]
MRKGFLWPFLSLVLAVVAVVLVIVTVNERWRHVKDVQTLTIKLRELSQKKSPRFTRKLLGVEEPLIFIGGVLESGTTLLRTMLDFHPDIRCGKETVIITSVLYMREQWANNHLLEVASSSGVTQQSLDDASSAFISEIITKHDVMAKRLCNEEPYSAAFMVFLNRMFTNSKHILMIRDARATIYSMTKRNMSIAGYNRTNFPQMFEMWNVQLTKMINMCMTVKESCLIVFYERLIQRTESDARRILKFLDVPWSDDVIQLQKIDAKETLNRNETSTSQMKVNAHMKSLTSWFGFFSNNTLDKLDKLAPLLKKLGYDTSSHEPNYTIFTVDDFYEKLDFSKLFR